jgi:hypothetical protein
VVPLDNKIKRKIIPVTGRGGPQVCETSRSPHFLHNRLTDGGEVVSVIRSIEKSNDRIENETRDLLAYSVVPLSMNMWENPNILRNDNWQGTPKHLDKTCPNVTDTRSGIASETSTPQWDAGVKCATDRMGSKRRWKYLVVERCREWFTRAKVERTEATSKWHRWKGTCRIGRPAP